MPCIGRQILNHEATREVLVMLLKAVLLEMEAETFVNEVISRVCMSVLG